MNAKKINSFCLAVMIIIGCTIMGLSIRTSKTGMSSSYSKSVKTLADKLTVGCDNDAETTQAIYNYIVSNYKYDYDAVTLFQHVNINKTIKSKRGICFDFSHLFAALCRTKGIPCVVINAKDGSDRHSWNRCYVQGKWLEVDLTNDIVVYSTGEGTYYGFIEVEGRDAPADGYKIYLIL